jgi:hypothetical protein
VNLSIYFQVLPKSDKHCPGCVSLQNGSTVIDYHSIQARANISVRAIELCVNMMSPEHTCYHSDHAMSRCMIHGMNAIPYSIECGGSRLGDDGLAIGMCMGTDGCDNRIHFTCHRWFPSPTDYNVPLNLYGPGVWAAAHPAKNKVASNITTNENYNQTTYNSTSTYRYR